MAINANFDYLGSFLEAAASDKNLFERIPKANQQKYLANGASEAVIGGELGELSINSKKRKKRNFLIQDDCLVIYRVRGIFYIFEN